MHVIIQRGDLVRAITSARATVPSRSTIPILGNVKLYANGHGRLEITGTDLDRQCLDAGAADVRAPGSITVPADLLTQIAKSLPDGAVTLELDADGERMHIRAGRSRYCLATLPAADYPEIGSGESPVQIDLAATAAVRLFGETLFATSTDTTRPYLCGCLLHTPASTRIVRSVVTDGHRMISVETPLPDGATPLPEGGVIVPRQAMADISRLADGIDGDISLTVSRQRIGCRASGFFYVSKLIDGSFPDYARVTPAIGTGHAATVDRAELAAAAARMAAALDAKSPAFRMAFDPAAGEIVLACPQDARVHDASDAVAARDMSGAAMETGISARYLIEQLGAMRGADVIIDTAGQGRPLRLIDVGHDTDVHVIMPMRV